MLIKIRGAPVSFFSRRQQSTSCSTAEAEYQALSAAVKELEWLRTLVKEIGYEQREPTVVHEDNQSAIHMATREGVSGRSKHMVVRLSHVREAIAAKMIKLQWIETTVQEADLLTKPVAPQTFTKLSGMIMGDGSAL